MGQWVSVDVAFGIDLGQGIPEMFYLTDNHRKEWQDNSGDISMFLDFWIDSKGEDFYFPFQCIKYCSYESDLAKYFLAYTPSIHSGESDEPVFFDTSNIDIDNIVSILQNNGFGENVQPRWAAVSIYG